METTFNPIDERDAEEEFYLQSWLSENRHKYEPHLRTAIVYHLQESLKSGEKLLAQYEADYAMQVKKGVPFLERMALGKKVKAGTQYCNDVRNILQNLTPRPFEQWLTYYDVKRIEAVGFRDAIGDLTILHRTYEPVLP